MDMLMSTIDDIKLKLTDMEYKTLCDQMAVVHKEKEKTEGYCELKFSRFMPRPQGRRYGYDIEIKTLIVKTNCDMSMITRMKHAIEESGSYSMSVATLADLTRAPLEAHVLWDEYMSSHNFVTRNEKHEDDDENERIEYVDTNRVYLQKAGTVPLISIKML